MTELKTLKDIYPEDYEVLEIRKEAIKWIKEARDQNKIKGNDNMFRCDEYSCQKVEDWIKHFFSITEEDIK